VGYPRWLAINPSVGSKGDAYDNGKAERFIRTRLELWAYACPYADERQRTIALAPVLDSYNRFRRCDSATVKEREPAPDAGLRPRGRATVDATVDEAA